MSKCPVLNELETREAYDPEYEQTPHLSGGDYDISAIRDCAENCKIGEINWTLERDRAVLRVASTKYEARIEELTKEAARMHLALTRIVNGDTTVSGMKATANAARIEELAGIVADLEKRVPPDPRNPWPGMDHADWAQICAAEMARIK